MFAQLHKMARDSMSLVTFKEIVLPTAKTDTRNVLSGKFWSHGTELFIIWLQRREFRKMSYRQRYQNFMFILCFSVWFWDISDCFNFTHSFLLLVIPFLLSDIFSVIMFSLSSWILCNSLSLVFFFYNCIGTCPSTVTRLKLSLHIRFKYKNYSFPSKQF